MVAQLHLVSHTNSFNYTELLSQLTECPSKRIPIRSPRDEALLSGPEPDTATLHGASEWLSGQESPLLPHAVTLQN